MELSTKIFFWELYWHQLVNYEKYIPESLQ